MLEKGVLLDGKYRIEGRIASGGQAHVYRAEQIGLGRRVAIKVLRVEGKPSANSNLIKRFEREARLLSTLRDPHTITLFDYGHLDNGGLFMVFEFIDGMSLKEVILDEGRLAPSRVAKILRQMLLSLQEAHAFGVLHRDIKPQNVLLYTHAGRRDQVKLIDFGIAKILDNESADLDLTATDHVVGTPRYIAPELIFGQEPSAASDLYSVGLIGFELLTGQNAVVGRTPIEVVRQQVAPESITLPRELPVPQGLRSIIDALMMKPRELRYEAAEQVIEDLHHWNEHRSVARIRAEVSGPEEYDPYADRNNRHNDGSTAMLDIAELISAGHPSLPPDMFAQTPPQTPSHTPPPTKRPQTPMHPQKAVRAGDQPRAAVRAEAPGRAATAAPAATTSPGRVRQRQHSNTHSTHGPTTRSHASHAQRRMQSEPTREVSTRSVQRHLARTRSDRHDRRNDARQQQRFTSPQHTPTSTPRFTQEVRSIERQRSARSGRAGQTTHHEPTREVSRSALVNTNDPRASIAPAAPTPAPRASVAPTSTPAPQPPAEASASNAPPAAASFNAVPFHMPSQAEHEAPTIQTGSLLDHAPAGLLDDARMQELFGDEAPAAPPSAPPSAPPAHDATLEVADAPTGILAADQLDHLFFNAPSRQRNSASKSEPAQPVTQAQAPAVERSAELDVADAPTNILDPSALGHLFPPLADTTDNEAHDVAEASTSILDPSIFNMPGMSPALQELSVPVYTPQTQGSGIMDASALGDLGSPFSEAQDTGAAGDVTSSVEDHDATEILGDVDLSGISTAHLFGEESNADQDPDVTPSRGIPRHHTTARRGSAPRATLRRPRVIRRNTGPRKPDDS